MNFAFDDEQRLLRNEIVRFAREALSPGAAERDRTATFDRDLWRAAAEMGLPGLPVPEAYGGGGLDGTSTAVALEALGYGCEDGGLVFALGAHLLACVVPIWLHGTEAQRERWLPGLCDGSRIAANAMTEADSGSDAFTMSTRAERHGEGFRLHGAKTFCSNAPVADVALVYAVTDPDRGYHGGVTAFAVEIDAPGVAHGQTFEKMGLRSCSIGELVFDAVEVGEDAAIGGIGGGATVFEDSMDWERTCLAACHVGTIQRLLEGSIAYARERTAFGRSIGSYQAISHRLVDFRVRLEATRLLVHKAAAGLGRRDARPDASAAKLFASEALVESALDAIRVLGGSGFMTDYAAERALRDGVGGLLYSGTNEIQKNVIARWMGL